MSEYEHTPYYDWDDEDDELEYHDQEYYQNRLANRHQINERHLYGNNDQMYNKEYQPRLSTDEENLSPSSSDDQMQRVPNTNKMYENQKQPRNSYFEQPELNYSHSNTDRYTVNNVTDSQQNELLTITVEIGDGQKENIIIMENDKPEEVAQRFWNKYQLSDELLEIFTEQIEQNINQVKQEIISEKESVDEEYHQEQISTAIDNYTPRPKSNVQPYLNSNSYRNTGVSPNLPVSNYDNFCHSQHVNSNEDNSITGSEPSSIYK